MNNEFENKNINTDESNNAKRLRMLGDDSSEDIHLKSDAEVKGAFWPNFWFRYKWYVIIISAFVLIFTVFLIQGLNTKKYDVGVLYAGPTYVVDIQNDIANAFKDFAKDANGDGEKYVLVSTNVYMNEEQQIEAANGNKYDQMALYSANIQAYKDFQQQMLAGNIIVCLMDPSLFEDYKEAFSDVSDILGYEPDSSLMYAENAINFQKTDFAKSYECFKRLPKDTLLCIMTTHQLTPDASREVSIDLFKAVVNFEA